MTIIPLPTTDAPKSYAQQLTDRARAALKAAGIKGVTVASQRLTHDRELIFTVRDPATSIEAVQKIADTFSKVDRCDVSGETLAGGNCYVTVRLGDKVRQHALTLWEPVIRDTAAKLPEPGTNSGVTMDRRLTVFREAGRASEWKIWNDAGPRAWSFLWIPPAMTCLEDAAATLFREFGAPQPLAA